MANSEKILNQIRTFASDEYRGLVPLATNATIKDVGNPIIQYQHVANEFLQILINKIAMTVVKNRTFNNPLRVLKKGGIPLGTDIEEIYTNPAESGTYDETGANLLSRQKPDVKSSYHRLNRQDRYKVTINQDQLAHAFFNSNSFSDFVASIINSLYSGDNKDEFALMKKIIGDSVDGDKIIKIPVADIIDEVTAKAFVRQLRTLVTNFEFPSTQYNIWKNLNPADTAVTTWTPRENQVILLRSDVEAFVDVEVLASAFNLDKTTLLSQTLIVDNFDNSTNCIGILADKSWIQVFDNMEKMTEFYNPEGLYWNYYRHHWQTYSYSPFANAVAFIIS